MPESTIAKTNRDITVQVYDLADANSYTFAFERGDFKLAIPGPTIALFLDRGQFTDPPQIRKDQDQPMTGSITADLRDVYDASYTTAASLIVGSKPAGWTSRGGANADVDTWKVLITIEGTNHGDAADHTLLCDYCKFSGSLGDGMPCPVELSFTSYKLYPTVT